MEQPAALMGSFFQYLPTFLPAFVVLGVLLQLFFCYTIQVIADKRELPASWLAWVPILQIYPVVKAGDSSIAQLVVWMLSGIAIAIAGALVSAILPPVVGLLALLVWGVWGLVFFVRMLWNTARLRGLSGWMGVLCFVPLLGMLAYLAIAFHDGLRRPHPIGLVFGVLLYVLPAVPSLRQASQVGELGQAIAAGAGGDEAGMRRTLERMDAELEPGEDSDLARLLARMIGAMSTEAEAAPPVVPLLAGRRIDVPGFDSQHGFPVPDAVDCPPGTSLRGAAPPAGSEQWCELALPGGGIVRHGWYRAWHRNGQLREAGAFEHGQRSGVWTRWYASGGKRTQAQFAQGLQHGLLLGWDEFGRKQRETWFQDGEPTGG